MKIKNSQSHESPKPTRIPHSIVYSTVPRTRTNTKPPATSDVACIGATVIEKELELELELIQTQMTQKPMLRAEVYARALRASQNRKEDSL